MSCSSRASLDSVSHDISSCVSERHTLYGAIVQEAMCLLGWALDATICEFMESHFGRNFSQAYGNVNAKVADSVPAIHSETGNDFLNTTAYGV